jgi:NifU-like protein involved in Fe-S cluster formation
MECPDLIGRGSLDGHPPVVTLYLRIGMHGVSAAKFEADGCGVTIACGSMLTELIRGRSLAECRQLTAHALAEALDGIPPGKEY